MTWGRAGFTAVGARASPAEFGPGGGWGGAVEAPFDALAALRRLPQLDVRLDLPGVALEVVGVDREPVLGRVAPRLRVPALARSEEHTSELQSQSNLVCRLLLEKKKRKQMRRNNRCSGAI